MGHARPVMKPVENRNLSLSNLKSQRSNVILQDLTGWILDVCLVLTKSFNSESRT